MKKRRFGCGAFALGRTAREEFPLRQTAPKWENQKSDRFDGRFFACIVQSLAPGQEEARYWAGLMPVAVLKLLLKWSGSGYPTRSAISLTDICS